MAIQDNMDTKITENNGILRTSQTWRWTYCRIRTCCYNHRVIYAKAMNKAPIKAIKKETASLLASLFFIALEVGILRMPANERRSREIGAYTIDLLSQDNVVSKRKKPMVWQPIVVPVARSFHSSWVAFSLSSRQWEQWFRCRKRYIIRCFW